jgi:glycosyltransferase involved in cell wall biosynthesis
MALVSVVIPTCNRRRLVCESIESVLNQSGVRPEVIVIDDGSTDGTRGELERFADRISYVYQANRGVAAARNLGARLAHGEWLAFLDSDDLWLPRKLADQLEFHRRQPEIAISQTEEIWMRRGTRVNPCRHHRKPDGEAFLASLRRCVVSPSSVLLRRELFESVSGFDESFPVCEDYDLWLRVTCRNAVGLVPSALVVKRGGHEDQLSRRFWGMDRFRAAAILKLLATDQLSRNQREAALEVLGQKCRILAGGALRRGRADEAGRYLRLARLYTTHGGPERLAKPVPVRESLTPKRRQLAFPL